MPPREDPPVQSLFNLIGSVSGQLTELAKTVAELTKTVIRTDTRFESLQGSFDELKEKFAEVTDKLWGNGKPGLIEELHGLENSVKTCQANCHDDMAERKAVRKELRWWSGRTATAIIASVAGALVAWTLTGVKPPVKAIQDHRAADVAATMAQ